MESFATLFFSESLRDLWQTFLLLLPRLIGVLVVILCGVVAASVLEQIVLKFCQAVDVDAFVRRLEVARWFNRSDKPIPLGKFFGWLVKWFVFILSAVVVTEMLGWHELTSALKGVVNYLPSVFLGVIILVVGSLLSSAVKRIVASSLTAADVPASDVWASVAQGAILLFSILAALLELNIAPELIRIIFAGLVAMLSLAGGLAFGLGGKDHASRLLSRLEDHWSSRGSDKEKIADIHS